MTSSRATRREKPGPVALGRPLQATREAGFTLTELAVVITVLGILSGIAAFSLHGVSGKGQADACRTDTATLKTAEEAYYTGVDPNTQAVRHQYAPTVSALLVAKLLAGPPMYHDVVTTKLTLPATDPGHFVDPVNGQPVTLIGANDATLLANNPVPPEAGTDGTFYYLITKPGTNGRPSPCVTDPVSAAQQSHLQMQPNVSLPWLLTLPNSGTVL